MTKREKLLRKAQNNPQGLSFREFKTLLNQFGWVEDHQTGSHSIWYNTEWQSINFVRLTIQNKNGMAKGYQVKQFLTLYEEEHKNERAI